MFPQSHRVQRMARLFWQIVTASCCAMGAAPVAAQALVIQSASFALPTDRYPHNVLGSLRGFGALDVTTQTGQVLRLTLPQTRVFEDIAPRLWDVTGDTEPEIVVVESDAQLGARLTAWTIEAGPTGPVFRLRGATRFIGTRFRWLAPVGAADFTGDGQPDLAYVAMPHLARQLVLVTLQGDDLVPVARLDNVSSHKIGQEFITGSIVTCAGAPSILVPSGDWAQQLRVIYADGALRVAQTAPLPDGAALTLPQGCVR